MALPQAPSRHLREPLCSKDRRENGRERKREEGGDRRRKVGGKEVQRNRGCESTWTRFVTCSTEQGGRHPRRVLLSERLSAQSQRMFTNQFSKNCLHQRCR